MKDAQANGDHQTDDADLRYASDLAGSLFGQTNLAAADVSDARDDDIDPLNNRLQGALQSLRGTAPAGRPRHRTGGVSCDRDNGIARSDSTALTAHGKIDTP